MGQETKESRCETATGGSGQGRCVGVASWTDVQEAAGCCWGLGLAHQPLPWIFSTYKAKALSRWGKVAKSSTSLGQGQKPNRERNLPYEGSKQVKLHCFKEKCRSKSYLPTDKRLLGPGLCTG